MSDFDIKGWCPGALRPMMSGDGLLVRARVHAGRLTPEQAAGIAALSRDFGNGLLDLSARANLQIRGVAPDSHPAVLNGLASLGLLDGDERRESERNIQLTPFWAPGDGTCELAHELEEALAVEPLDLPAKFGFAIDCGPERVLAPSSADIRIERGAIGGLIVRANGVSSGRAVSQQDCITLALSMARWFVSATGRTEKRMARHLASGAALPEALRGDVPPVVAKAPCLPGMYEAGALVGIAFGQLTAETLSKLAGMGQGIRLTPWRMLLIEGLTELPISEHLITSGADPLLRVAACSGAPDCSQARGPTRPLARDLAPLVPEGSRLHVSGCPKGCAHPSASEVTLVAAGAGYDLVLGGSANQTPARRELTPSELRSMFAKEAGKV